MRFQSIERITTADLELEFDAAELETVSAAVQPIEEARAKSGLSLVSFPTKNQPPAPAWRDELKKRIELARGNRAPEAAPPPAKIEKPAARFEKTGGRTAVQPQTEAALVINLTPNMVEQKQKQRLVSQAMERIENSRRRFENQPETSVAAALSVETAVKILDEKESKPKAAATDAPLSLVPPIRLPRKILSPIVDDSAAFDEKFDLTAPEKIADAPQKDSLRESNAAAFNDLDDEDAIAASLNSVRTAVAPRSSPLADQQPAPRASAAAGRTKTQRQLLDDYAPVGHRFVAGTIDFLLCAGIGVGVLWGLKIWQMPSDFSLATVWLPLAAFGVTAFLYFTAALFLTGTTMGLRLFRLQVVAVEDGFAPTFFQAVLNTLASLLTLALGAIGFAVVFLNHEKRALHDSVAGTIVVKDEEVGEV